MPWTSPRRAPREGPAAGGARPRRARGGPPGRRPGAAAVAEHRLAGRIAARQSGLVGVPQVTLAGFPFVLEAARGSYPEVRVRADAVTAAGRQVRADVDLRRVTGSGGGYRAAGADARFTLPFGQLGGALGPGTALSADHGRLRIDRSVLGLPLTVTAEVRLAGGAVTLRPLSASLAGRPMDPADPRLTAAFGAADRTVPPLPLGLVPTGVSVGDDGVTLRAAAKGVHVD
ncbi:DUF2993 domain-containing protein [Kitasatospora sp. NPDC059571]|uniref:LmeA family phospholipid-binding protein n=1 Tax=Kitasatospora sp. NPDC059571 TaxID=3346871 RepID=UPI0036A19984